MKKLIDVFIFDFLMQGCYKLVKMGAEGVIQVCYLLLFYKIYIRLKTCELSFRQCF